MKKSLWLVAILALVIGGLLVALMLTGGGSDGSEPPELDEDALLPLVFVHGSAGSAAELEPQVLRLASNGSSTKVDEEVGGEARTQPPTSTML